MDKESLDYREMLTERNIESFFSQHINLFSVLDDKGFIKAVNPRWQKTLGLSQTELVGSRIHNHIHPEDIEKTISSISLLKETGEYRNFINRIRSKDGEYQYIEWQSSFDGELYYCSGVDVTQRILLEAEISRKEAFVKDIVSQVPGGIYQLRRFEDGTITIPFHSEGFLTFFHVTSEEIDNDPTIFFTKIYPDDLAMVFESVKRSAITMEIWRLEFRIYAADGELRWVRGRSKPSLLKDNSIVWDGHIYDVTEEKKQELQLREHEEKIRGLFSQAPGMLFQYDLEPDGSSCFSLASNGIWDLIQVTPWEAKYEVKKVFERVHKNDANRVSVTMNESAMNGTIWTEELRIYHPTKGVRWVRGNAKPSKLQDGTLRYYGYVYDITELKMKESEIAEQEHYIHEISRRVPGVLYQFRYTEEKGYYFHTATGGISELLGKELSHQEIQKLSLTDYIHPEDIEHICHALHHSEKTMTTFQESCRFISFQGEVKWVRANSSPVRLENGDIVWSGYLHDITVEKKQELALQESEKRYRNLAKRMETMANQDPLTSLPNRRFLEKHLAELRQDKDLIKRKIGILYLDLDDFKTVNDRFGHECGDQLLRRVATILKTTVGQTDKVFRMAGDEFLVVLENIENECNLENMLHRLIRAFNVPLEVEDRHILVGASIGAVLYPDHGEELEALLSKADRAMYHMKRSSKAGYTIFKHDLE
ncbi:diguanylate cyclase [Paenalkalicoccus suaedae]|uniref:Diguanylate cyclase n=1 Tax=Paenalkalicoccus suaedae TaxID=2592382 RepID=A0A859FB85_9BACI|nr:diguanylate cyclase [Paenalkalicoccus suaedae]QKS70529.1 diguanylate cyclase [Paenalkalicoccus suaedae]